MSTLILLATNEKEFNEELIEFAKEHRPDTKWILPNDKRAPLAEVAACWFPQSNTLTQFPNIKCLLALSAGVDHLGDTLLTSGLPVCRIVDESQKQGMFEYVLWGILNQQRDLETARKHQMAAEWVRYPRRSASQMTVGILGLGALGEYVAKELTKLGYQVCGWSRSQKHHNNITCYSGEEGLTRLLNQSNIVVNLLPLNASTHGILNTTFFESMQAGSYLINCGRGEHMVNADLLSALNSGHLSGALLDVFHEEPLPASDPLWKTNNVIITPHIASDASLPIIVNHTANNAIRFSKKQPLLNAIDSIRGY